VSDVQLINTIGSVTAPSFMATRGGSRGGILSTLVRSRYLGCAMALRRELLFGVFIALLLGTCSLAMLSSVSMATFRVDKQFFALLPLGVSLAASCDDAEPRHIGPLCPLQAALAYIFLSYGPYLRDPTIDVLNE
jgi:hypothetical protein